MDSFNLKIESVGSAVLLSVGLVKLLDLGINRKIFIFVDFAFAILLLDLHFNEHTAILFKLSELFGSQVIHVVSAGNRI